MTDGIFLMKPTPIKAFNESFHYFADMLTYIFKMCMKKFDADFFSFIFFLQYYLGLNFVIFRPLYILNSD